MNTVYAVRTIWQGSILALGLSGTAGAIVVDGSRDGDDYGAPLAVQAVQTQFGNRTADSGGSELDAAYGRIENGTLFLLLTGNLENNFNKLEIFIDSVPGGQNAIDGLDNPLHDDDWSATFGGIVPDPPVSPFTFDAGFEADYFFILRNGLEKFDLDYSVIGGGIDDFDTFEDVFGGTVEGQAITELGFLGFQFGVAFDNSNVEGVADGTLAADQVAAAAVTTGIELGIPLAALGDPAGEIKVTAFINGSGHDFASNQFLGSLPTDLGNGLGLETPVPGTANLGSDGMSNFVMDALAIDLSTLAGEQFFTVPVAPPGPPFRITSFAPTLVAPGSVFYEIIWNSIPSTTYRIQQSTDLITWTDVPGSSVTATGTSASTEISVDPEAEERVFWRVATGAL